MWFSRRGSSPLSRTTKRKEEMNMLKTIIMILFLIVCLALSGIILLQEGKSAGLGSIAGMADSYWSKAKSRSMEGNLSKLTTVLAIGFLLLALVLNIVW